LTFEIVPESTERETTALRRHLNRYEAFALPKISLSSISIRCLAFDSAKDEIL
jgi:hypothetical protein